MSSIAKGLSLTASRSTLSLGLFKYLTKNGYPFTLFICSSSVVTYVDTYISYSFNFFDFEIVNNVVM